MTTIAIYENCAGSQGWVEQVGTEDYLNAGCLTNLRNYRADLAAIEAFAENKFAAAEYEAKYGHLPIKNGVFFGKICPGTNGF